MRLLSEVMQRLLGLFRRSAEERELRDEIRFHVDMEAERLIREHRLSADEAHRRAMIAFGGVERIKEEVRDERGTRWFDDLAQDIRYAIRTLRNNPAFTFVAVLTLALGIGANSAMFSVVNGVLLTPLPFTEPDRLVRIYTAYPDEKAYLLSAPDFESVREQNRVFTGIAGWSSNTVTMTGVGDPSELQAAVVTHGFFELLGVAPHLGRGFQEEEHEPGQGRVLLLGDGFWRREFGADSSIIGRNLILDGTPYTIIGVMPPTFDYPAGTQLYTAVERDETFDASTIQTRRSEWLQVLGRMEGGVTLGNAEADLRSIGQRLQQTFPETNERLTFTASRLHEVLVGDVRGPLLTLLAAVGLVLLIACANVANLLLTRSTAREGELAVRTALGASRGRLVRQVLTESVVLGLFGGVSGLLLAVVGTRALVAAQPSTVPRLDQIGVDGTVIAVTATIALLTSVVFGSAPALQAAHGSLVTPLKTQNRGGSSRYSRRMRNALVIAEMALAVTLAVGAGLLMRSFLQLMAVDPGFRPERAVAFRVSLPEATYSEGNQRRVFFRTLRERLASLPSVSDVGGVNALPLTGGADMLIFSIEGRDRTPDRLWEIRALSVTPGYFQAMSIPLRRGRFLTEQDRVEAPSVVAINQAAAEQWFPGEDPIRKRLIIGEPWEIVGVVADVKQYGLARDVVPEVYVPHEQWSVASLRIVVRVSGDPLALADAIRSQVHALDPNIPVERFATLDEVVAESVAQPQFYTVLLGIFAGVAFLLAAIGIFGVISYTVLQRMREIAIRMAVGAEGGNVAWLVVRHALTLAGVGLGLGVLGAWAFTRILRNLLFGVEVGDPVTYVGVTALLTVVVLLASYLPARAATRVDLNLALRSDS